MSASQFKIQIGAKRQLTLPAELLRQLQIPDRGELMVEIIGDHAVITPMVSMPRAQLPEALRRTFESRRGAQSSDIPVDQFLAEVGYPQPHQTADPPRASWQQRIDGLTPNERELLGEIGQPALAQPQPQGLTEREKQVLDQIVRAGSNREIAHTLHIEEPAAKPYVAKIEQILDQMMEITAQDETESLGS